MVKVGGLYKCYGKKQIINDFNYSFNDSGLYLITGNSGCGKTTLLNIISGLDKDYMGVVNSEEMFFLRDQDLIDNFTVKENIELFEDIFEDFKYRKDDFGLDEIMNKKISKLSCGERQRIVVYISLCVNVKTILLDEPLSSLDEKSKLRVVKSIEKESKNKLFIVVSHDIFNFNQYTLIDLMNGKFIDKIEIPKKINSLNNKKIDVIKWGSKLINKSFISMLAFIVAIFGFCTFIKNINNEIVNVKMGFNNSFNKGELLYKENDVQLDRDSFYNEIVVMLANEIVNYGSSVYDQKMYSDSVYVDKYYLDNGFIFSNVYIGDNIKEDEVIVSIDYDSFCQNNNLLYCQKEEIKSYLISKKLEYRGDKSYYYTIRDVIEGENQIFLSDIGVTRMFKEEFKKYSSRYYISIDNDKLYSFYNKINKVNSLLKYDFVPYYEDENLTYYLISEAEKMYFNYDELSENNLLGCSEIISCDIFYFKDLVGVRYIDEFKTDQKVQFDLFENKLSNNEIVLSSSLSNILNKNQGDSIKIKYVINGNLYIQDFNIKSIYPSDNLTIYGNANYLYENIVRLTGETIRIEYAYGDNTSYNTTPLLHSNVVDNTIEVINNFFIVINICFYFIGIMILVILFLLEYKKTKRYLKIYSNLKRNGINNLISLSRFYMLMYIFVGIAISFIDIYLGLSCFALIIVLNFKYEKKIKIQD